MRYKRPTHKRLSDLSVVIRKNTRKVKCLETGKEYGSIKEASYYTGVSSTLISRSCIRGETIKGFTFEYLN